MDRKFKILAVDRNERYWLSELEELLSGGYIIVRVERVSQGLFKGEAIIFILENPYQKLSPHQTSNLSPIDY